MVRYKKQKCFLQYICNLIFGQFYFKSSKYFYWIHLNMGHCLSSFSWLLWLLLFSINICATQTHKRTETNIFFSTLQSVLAWKICNIFLNLVPATIHYQRWMCITKFSCSTWYAENSGWPFYHHFNLSRLPKINENLKLTAGSYSKSILLQMEKRCMWLWKRKVNFIVLYHAYIP